MMKNSLTQRQGQFTVSGFGLIAPGFLVAGKFIA